MKLNIQLETFKSTFIIKEEEETPGYRSLSATGHKSGIKLKLFPFDTHVDPVLDTIKDLRNIVGGFMRHVQKERMISFTFETFLKELKTCVHFPSERDEEQFESIIKNMFFNYDNQFTPTNIGTYKLISCNAKEEKIAAYLCDTLSAGYDVNQMVTTAIGNGNYNVLESLVMTLVKPSNLTSSKDPNPYKVIVSKIQEVFYNDFYYMLRNTKFAKEYLTDFLEHYYFFYTSQACMLLNQFFNAKRDIFSPLYYCIDWEKTSKNRPCYFDGWLKLQRYLITMYSHAVTLEILNQNDDKDKLDYIDIYNIICEYPELDDDYSNQIINAANFYRSCIHEKTAVLELQKIELEDTETKTEQAIKFLYNSILTQYEYSNRRRGNIAYANKFEIFCKTKVLKNRGTMGLMLNLTERDLLLLTKLSLKDKERMRLNDVFFEFEKRGVFLDTPSKLIVMNYYEKLNLIEKKSDSGDAQYVKGIL